MEVFVDYASS